MSPKNKAEELIERYRTIAWEDTVSTEEGSWHTDVFSMSEVAAKQCALIVVDEILSDDIPRKNDYYNFGKAFWKDVKTEIENL